MRFTSIIACFVLLFCAGCFGGDDDGDGCSPACSAGYTCQDGACVAQGGGGPSGEALDGHQFGTGEVIATGEHGTLKLSSAEAFIEAFAFVLSYLSGNTIAFTPQEHQQLLDAFKVNYPTVDKDTQIVMARFDEVWAEVEPQWNSAPEADRNAFAYLVLVVAFGREAVEAWLQENGSSGGSSDGSACDGSDIGFCAAAACGTADCWEAYSDTNNTMSCWASAGCSDYDASTNEYTYDDYND